MAVKKFGALSSSTDPEQVSNTVKGIVLSFGALIMLIAPDTDINVLASQIGFAAGGLWAAYGLLMKFVVFVNSKFFVKETL